MPLLAEIARIDMVAADHAVALGTKVIASIGRNGSRPRRASPKKARRFVISRKDSSRARK
jgi:hypothetical protein